MNQITIEQDNFESAPNFNANSPIPSFDTINEKAFNQNIFDWFKSDIDGLGFYHGVVNIPALAEFIKSKLVNETFDYKLYKSSKIVHLRPKKGKYSSFVIYGGLKDPIKKPISIPLETTINGETVKIYSKCRLNTRKYLIDRFLIASFDFNSKKEKASYVLIWNYKKSKDKVFLEKFSAIEIEFLNFEELMAFANYCGYINISYIKLNFIFTLFEERLNIWADDTDRLEWFYNNIPIDFAKKLSLDDLYKDLLKLVELDNEWFNEANEAIVNVLKGIAQKPNGMKWLYEKFYANPNDIIRIYNELDGTTKSEYNEGKIVPNKTYFASFLNALCQKAKIDNYLKSQNHITLKIQKNKFRVNSNLLWDEKDKTIQLDQEILTKTEYNNVPTVFYNITTSYSFLNWGKSSKHPLHPLTMVKLLEYSDEENKFKIRTLTAIEVKNLADHDEWERIDFNLRIGFNLLAIALASLTPLGPLGSTPLVVATLLEAGIAATDLFILANEDELINKKGGKEFVKNWHEFYNISNTTVGIVGVGALFRSLLKNGFKVLGNLQKLSSNVDIQKELVKDLKNTLYLSENLAKFVDGTLEIIVDYSKLSKNGFIFPVQKMQNLAKEGVYLLEGIAKGETVKKYYLAFQDVILEYGELKKIKKAIQELGRKVKLELVKYLDELAALKAVKNETVFRKIVYSKGQRGERLLTQAEKSEIINYAEKYGITEESIRFQDDWSDLNTGYGLMFGKDILNINTDVMPGILNNANSRLSWKAAIAHELEGHMKAARQNKTFFDPELGAIDSNLNMLFEEIQASLRASEHGLDLSKIERSDLLQDALERFQNHNEILKNTKYENYTFEQIKELLWITKN